MRMVIGICQQIIDWHEEGKGVITADKKIAGNRKQRISGYFIPPAQVERPGENAKVNQRLFAREGMPVIHLIYPERPPKEDAVLVKFFSGFLASVFWQEKFRICGWCHAMPNDSQNENICKLIKGEI